MIWFHFDGRNHGRRCASSGGGWVGTMGLGWFECRWMLEGGWKGTLVEMVAPSLKLSIGWLWSVCLSVEYARDEETLVNRIGGVGVTCCSALSRGEHHCDGWFLMGVDMVIATEKKYNKINCCWSNGTVVLKNEFGAGTTISRHRGEIPVKFSPVSQNPVTDS